MNNDPVEIKFEKISSASADQIAYLTLNRPEAANSFNGEVLDKISSGLDLISKTEGVRAVIVSGRGRHFSAGADLGWMKNSANLGLEENKQDAEKLVKMFESLCKLQVPTIAVIKGAAFGGAVGLAACCDIAIAFENSKFCLSETKLGILPAVILPYLSRKMAPGQLRRLGITAKVFDGNEALNFGLVELVVNENSIDEVLKTEINSLLNCGPDAVTKFNTLLDNVKENSNKQGQYCVDAIAETRIGPEAQAGFTAFFNKESTPWSTQLEKNWKFDA